MDGRPNGRTKATFSNSSCVARTGVSVTDGHPELLALREIRIGFPFILTQLLVMSQVVLYQIKFFKLKRWSRHRQGLNNNGKRKPLTRSIKPGTGYV